MSADSFNHPVGQGTPPMKRMCSEFCRCQLLHTFLNCKCIGMFLWTSSDTKRKCVIILEWGGEIERVVSWSDAASSLLLCVSSEWPVSHSVLKCSAGEELVQQKGENEKGLFDRIIG